MDMITTFRTWYDRNCSNLQRLFEETEFREASPEIKVDKSSARIDFSNKKVLGRLSVWDTGECDLDILKVDTGESLIYEYRKSANMDELESNLNSLFDELKRLS